VSNSRRARRQAARARQPQPDPALRGWPTYTPQAARLLESAAVLDRPTEAATATVEQVSNRAWSDFGQADYTPEQWRRACLIDTGDGDEDSKSRHRLPVREPSGRLNRNGVHAAAARIGQVDVSAEAKRAAARALVRLYRSELDEEPPEGLLALAGMEEAHRQPARIRETVTAALREAPTGTPPTVDIQIIEAGWNRAGTRYYPPEVLARDVPKVYPAGTHMYLDHPTATEEAELPERSLTRLAAVFTGTPYSADGGRTMRVQARIFAPHREFVTEAWRDIGVSINGDGEGSYGERDGRHGLILEALTFGRSVDFVTKAGAGGRIVQLLESSTRLREARSVGAWLESRIHQGFTVIADDLYGEGRLTREERIALSGAIGDALDRFVARLEQAAGQLYQRDLHDDPAAAGSGGQVREATAEEVRLALSNAVRALAPADGYAYVEDYDPDRRLVWWCQSTDGGTTTWQQSYTYDDGQQEAALTGDRAEVVRRVTYEPAEPQETTAAESAAGTPASQDADGTPPAAPTNEGGESLMPEGTQNTGTTPAPAGTEGGLSPVARAEIAEAQVREAQSRISELTTQNATLTAERDTARTELGRMRVTEAARSVVESALADPTVDLPDPARRRVTESVTRDVPTTEAGNVDTNALTTRINEAITAERSYIASLREDAGEGRPNGLGGANGNGAVDVAKVQESLAEVYRRRGMSEQTAKLAAAGRN
jgi:hypothetical protein